ncbi:hypothetical protein [Aeromonas veronii]|uniref:hypothetical protein n=1 Tax=Aeromonas veronii TaxID=654 RepID=UPI003D1B9DCD
MHRNAHPTAPAGHHTDGDPLRGVPPTVVPAATMEALQEELANFIESRGIKLKKDDNTQLKQAILDAISRGIQQGDFVTKSEFQLHTQGGDPHQQYALESMLGEAAKMNVGSTGGTVASGDHAHAQYELKVSLKQAAYRDVGSGANQVAVGNHTHADYVTSLQLSNALNDSARVAIHWGDTQRVSFAIANITRLVILLNTSNYGWMQHEVDLHFALAIGEIRIYNRGGENADRNYDVRIAISRSNDTVTLSTHGLWPSTTIRGVAGYR